MVPKAVLRRCSGGLTQMRVSCLDSACHLPLYVIVLLQGRSTIVLARGPLDYFHLGQRLPRTLVLQQFVFTLLDDLFFRFLLKLRALRLGRYRIRTRHCRENTRPVGPAGEVESSLCDPHHTTLAYL